MAKNDKTAAFTSMVANYMQAKRSGEDTTNQYSQILKAYEAMSGGLGLVQQANELKFQQQQWPEKVKQMQAETKLTEETAKGKAQETLEKQDAFEQLKRARDLYEQETGRTPKLEEMMAILWANKQAKAKATEVEEQVKANQKADVYNAQAGATAAKAGEETAKSKREAGIIGEISTPERIARSGELRMAGEEEDLAGKIAARKLDEARALAEGAKGGKELNKMDYIKQYTALLDLQEKLAKTKLIDPLTFYIVKDDPEMTDYLKQAMGTSKDAQSALQRAKDLTDAIGAILRADYGINISALANYSRTTPTYLEELPGLPKSYPGNAVENPQPEMIPQAQATPTGTPTAPVTGTTTNVAGTDAVTMANAENVDPYLALAIVKQESRFNQSAISNKGAYGVMQLRPIAVEDVGGDWEETKTNARYNYLMGLKYLNKLKTTYGVENTDELIQQYNAGPGKTNLDYLTGVMENYNEYKQNPNLYSQDMQKLNELIGGTPAQATAPSKATPTQAPVTPSPKGTTTEKYPSSEAMGMFTGAEKPATQTPAPAPKEKPVEAKAPVLKGELNGLRNVLTPKVKSKVALDEVIAMRESGISYSDIIKFIEERSAAFQIKFGRNDYLAIIGTLDKFDKEYKLKESKANARSNRK